MRAVNGQLSVPTRSVAFLPAAGGRRTAAHAKPGRYSRARSKKNSRNRSPHLGHHVSRPPVGGWGIPPGPEGCRHGAAVDMLRAVLRLLRLLRLQGEPPARAAGSTPFSGRIYHEIIYQANDGRTRRTALPRFGAVGKSWALLLAVPWTRSPRAWGAAPLMHGADKRSPAPPLVAHRCTARSAAGRVSARPPLCRTRVVSHKYILWHGGPARRPPRVWCAPLASTKGRAPARVATAFSVLEPPSRGGQHGPEPSPAGHLVASGCSPV